MKKFFEKKVTDYKFKRAGPGHSLTEDSKASSSVKPDTQRPKPTRQAPSEAGASAGSAALARLESLQDKKSSEGTSKAVTATRELRRQQSGSTSEPEAASEASSVASKWDSEGEGHLEAASIDDKIVVHLVCPICQTSYPHLESRAHLSQCLHDEYLKEPLSSSVHMIYTLCQQEEKRKLCVDTLCKYLDNIAANPTEEKYRKIRINNKAFQERVNSVVGGDLFLEAVGFEQQLLPHGDGEEQFYVLPEEKLAGISELREVLSAAEPLKPEVDRNPTLFRPSPRLNKFNLSEEFYHLTLDEIRREQRLKTESVERESRLRTKAMRERDEVKMVVRHYRFALIRVRFPEGLILQGVFRPMEKLSMVRQFICDCLVDQVRTFTLSGLGKALTDDTSSLALLGLVPSAVLNLSWDDAHPGSQDSGLKPDLLARIQKLY